MITGLQLAILGGGLVGAGIAMLVWRLAPADPDLGETLARLSPEHARRPAETVQGAADSRERLGRWAMKTLPAAAWARVPVTELAVLRIPVARFYGEKVLYAFLGLLIPPLLTGFFAVMGLTFPVLIPAAATLGFAVLMFFLPDYNARDDAKKARGEFARALGAYIDLVALERNSGSGSRQAMEVAAEIGDSWVFRRLGEELARSRWSGVPPWDALARLATDLNLDALADLLPSATWTTPKGGFYVWVTLPDGLDATAMLPRAVTERVAYVPGTAFYADGQGRQNLRLSYCYPTSERIREGIRRLAAVVEAEIELLETFGGGSAGGFGAAGHAGRGQVQSPSPDLT